MRKQVLEMLMKHVDSLQGKGLKDLMESKKPKVEIEMESPEYEDAEHMGEPKGVSVSKLEIMKPKGDHDAKVKEAIESMGGEPEMDMDEEMSDEELQELLSKLIK